MSDAGDAIDEAGSLPEAVGRRVPLDPRVREFARLGWTLALMPLEMFAARHVASFFLHMMSGLQPDDICDLRARRIASGGKPATTCWVFAVRIDLARAHELRPMSPW